MSWKINKITFENFKVFKNRCDIPLDGKHFLLFGENGSGKSSINWGLYTFFQSVLKAPGVNDAQKYFNHAHEQHLRNRFSKDKEYSGIIIEFLDPVSKTLLVKEDSSTKIDTHATAPLNIPYSLAASDFLNYRYLNSLFDFKNSEDNDIFHILYSEVFPIDELRHTVTDINGNPQGNIIKKWWITLTDYLKSLPRDKAPNQNNIIQSGLPWDNFKNQLATFNTDLKHYLDNIELKTNYLLKKKFHLQAEISISYSKAVVESIVPDPINGNLKLRHPKIHLHASILHPGAVNPDLRHPRTFFNEAALNKMALAFRLAITENRLPAKADLCKILVIDDLLISLDMANRLSVIDILLDYSSSFQMLILTHDRSFYHTILDKLTERKERNNWNCSQIYIKPDLTHTQIPEAVIVNIKPGIDQAQDYYLSTEFEAAVVCLRKVCEQCLKKIVPLIRIIDRRKIDSGNIEYQDLNSMIKEYNKYIDNHLSLDLSSTMVNPSPNLHSYRKLLLNKAAHNDFGSPRFNHEIEQAFDEISKLCGIKKYVIVHSSNIGIDNFTFSITDSAGVTHSFNFKFGDVFSVLTANGTDYVVNANILQGTGIALLSDEIKRFCLAYSVPVPSNILQHITDAITGVSIADMLAKLKS